MSDSNEKTTRLSQRAPGEEREARPPGRLEDQGLIGKGGMGMVRRVFDRNLLRFAAMKVLDPKLAGDPREVQRFREEAQITGQLDHPHVPPVYELGADEGGTPWFTLKLLKGRTLADLLREHDFAPEDEGLLFRLLEIFVKVSQAVAFAHSRGVVHLDIKPANVMVGSHGQVYLMDWGIARVLPSPEGAEAGDVVELESEQAPEREGLVLGTFSYMAPEQAHARYDELDARTDIFSLGAVLYRILTGQAPYQAADREALHELAMAAQIAPPQELRPDLALPRRLCEIAMKALEPEPERRYPSVEALVADVEAFLRGEGRFEQRSYEPGAVVIREGEPGDAAYVVARGRCVAFKTVDGENQVLREMGPGDVFGEMSIFTDSPRSATVQALGPLSVTVVTRASLEQEVGQSRWMGRFVRALAERFREVEERATELRNVLDDVQLTNELLRYFALHAEGPTARRVAPWSPLAQALAERYFRSLEVVRENVLRLGMFEIDAARDEIALVAAASPPPFKGTWGEGA